MEYNTLQDLYIYELRDLYGAEKQIIRALPKMIKHSSAPALRDALEHHREVTRVQAERLEQIFERLGKSTRGSKCRGIEGIVEEAEEWLDQDAAPEVKDAGIISLAQRVEHYEIAAYGSVRSYAHLLGFQEDEGLLDQTLQEEGEADKKLTSCAEQINASARKEPAHAHA